MRAIVAEAVSPPPTTSWALELHRMCQELGGFELELPGDAQNAGICLAHGATLATRNTKDFDHVDGLELVNPWEFEG